MVEQVELKKIIMAVYAQVRLVASYYTAERTTPRWEITDSVLVAYLSVEDKAAGLELHTRDAGAHPAW